MESTFCDPLRINLRNQRSQLLAKIPADSAFAVTLSNISAGHEFLAILSQYLAIPAYTDCIATYYRPILFDLCARWIEAEETGVDHLVALCFLIQVHEELFPILFRILQRPVFQNGPLSVVAEQISTRNFDVQLLHRLLLAYYRILQANRQLPKQLHWPLTPLSTLMWSPDVDRGIRLLAIQCYALQSGMVESEREKVEREVFGDICGVNCPVHFGHTDDGSSIEIDGWLMPLLEMEQIRYRRRRLVVEPQTYYLPASDRADLTQEQLCPLVANIHGVLMLRTCRSNPHISSPVVSTPTAVQALRSLSTAVSLRLPVLITSPPSSGKSFYLTHLSNELLPESANQIVLIHLADTSLDPRSLLGSYVSSQTHSGTFEWREGVLVRAMREGKWVVFKDIDRGSSEVLGIIKPLVESVGPGKWIGGRAILQIPGHGQVIAANDFAIFATRSVPLSRAGAFPVASFYGVQKFFEISICPPSPDELRAIINTRFPSLSGPISRAVIRMWDDVVKLGTSASSRDIGLRELEKFCTRLINLLPSSHQSMDVAPDTSGDVPLSSLFPNPTLREEIYLEARDIFFGAGSLTSSARVHTNTVAEIIAQHLAIDPERKEWLLNRWVPEFSLEKDVNGSTVAVNAGRNRLVARPSTTIIQTVIRPFALHRPAILLLSRITTAVSLREPILLTGETGTGKTSIVTHLASILRCPLMSLNLSHQTESADLVGGFKPVDARVPAQELQEIFLELFGKTFSQKKNEKFEREVRRAVEEAKWKRAIGLWRESIRLAKERLQARRQTELDDTQTPRKRRKVNESSSSEAQWGAFEQRVEEFDIQHVRGKGKFAFGFVEGPLVKALRNGHWVLLDEINLASAETLECISSLLHSTTASITLTEQGSLEPVPRHPDFRLFACMNPATDVGKKDLPPNIRCRFTEIDVPPPDADRETLLHIIEQYIGAVSVGDKAAVMNVAEFYSAVKELSERRKIADGSNHRPNYSMRTLARALTFAADTAVMFGLRRALWEGCLMAFSMILNTESAELVTTLAKKHILAGVKNTKSLLARQPAVPDTLQNYTKFGPYYLQKGPLPLDAAEDYIITPSVETKLIDLSRIILIRRFPVLIEGPTSSGKTSSIEYLAKRTGHRFVRINNHEHTDIQEYIGSYVPDPTSGKLVFKDGLLVRALRNGDWIVLDELNLAPTDVLEALNRLLDDNRELVIPETQEIVRPHPHFMLFATQNPPGLYAGRKVLSRAFRNRFLEVHFEDVPQAELETILCQRCLIAPSYGKKIVNVFYELQKRRQLGRVFESKQGFATLRDLFRWAGRHAIGYQELAENGYMLLAERSRRPDDKAAVKEVLEKVMGVRIDERKMYDLTDLQTDFPTFLGCPIPSSNLVWTAAMQRLFVLTSRALRFNEPVLLVGETGSGKTSVCQVYAEAIGRRLHGLNCHQNTETADLIGGLRPVRGRGLLEAQILRDATEILQEEGVAVDSDAAEPYLDEALLMSEIRPEQRSRLQGLRKRLSRLKYIFEWHDGPLIEAMRKGEVVLLDEISLADDSVLERLNSVLESGRSIVLAEKGGDDPEDCTIVACSTFKLVATMNPGGDYGKKELSPALRNRFTEIWVPAVDDRRDIQMIVDQMWRHDALRSYTTPLLDFVEWLCKKVGDTSLMNLRDILAWVLFSNSALQGVSEEHMPAEEIFHHAAQMTYLDGLGSLPQLAGYSRPGVQALKTEASFKLNELVPLPDPPLFSFVPLHDPSEYVQLGSFAIPKGPKLPIQHTFNLGVPTTQDNAMRVVRACQVPKPILLEGSPGVGKTSLVTALANIAGYELHRINLSDQTDLIDLFGSDLPVEGGGPGEFAWKDAEFLRALQEGHWVLLDEMNLAPQAVLEGLNAVLDHRGAVYIPELGRSFTKHPQFRIFAAQNPLSQGGGRKGLPKSFVNRFTKVYMEELLPSDFLTVCRHLFSDIEVDILKGMVAFNSRLSEMVSVQRVFATNGSPWEFNLRDIVRWGSLMRTSKLYMDPLHYLRTVYLHRFRTEDDRRHARELFEDVFCRTANPTIYNPSISISPTFVQIGAFHLSRGSSSTPTRPRRVLKSQLPVLESLGHCVQQSWLSILVGPSNSGKTDVVRVLADFAGSVLQVVAINSATDTMDILGGFEQVDSIAHVLSTLRELLTISESYFGTSRGSHYSSDVYATLELEFQQQRRSRLSFMLDAGRRLVQEIQEFDSRPSTQLKLIRKILENADGAQSEGRFEWVDGPLVRAMKEGRWLLLDGANLCNPSVLDRLNSLCEPNGQLILTERGFVDGEVPVITPHPNFRLFMTVDPHYGELSRAMRNRGVEIWLPSLSPSSDMDILDDYNRVAKCSSQVFDGVRRGLYLGELACTSYHRGTGRALDQYSALSTLEDKYLPMLASQDVAHSPQSALFNVISRAFVPLYTPWLLRYLQSISNVPVAQHVMTLLSCFPRTVVSILDEWRRLYEETRGVLPIFLSAQEMDFFLSVPFTADSVLDPGIPSPHRLLLSLMEVGVANVHQDLKAIVADGHGVPATADSRQARALKAITALTRAVQHVATTAIEEIEVNREDRFHYYQETLDITLKIILFTQRLQKVETTHFDYSAIQAISGWIRDSVANGPTLHFKFILECATELHDIVSPTRGLGLIDIWLPFLDSRPLEVGPDILELETLCRRLRIDAKTQDLRRHTFDVMALKSLSVQDDRVSSDSIEKLASRLRETLTVHGEDHHPTFSPDEKSSLLNELGLLARYGSYHNIKTKKCIARAVENLVRLACQDRRFDMLHVIRHQHMSWSSDARTDGTHQILNIITELQSRWLREFCATELEDGSSTILHPARIQSVFALCDWTRHPLASVATYESDIRRAIEFTFLECEKDTSRIEQLETVALLSLVQILRCFDVNAAQRMCGRLSSPVDPDTVDSLLGLLESTGSAVLSNAIAPFMATFRRLGRPSSRQQHLSTIGSCYIAVFNLLVELYVPDTPIDPSIVHNSTQELQSEQHAALVSEISLHSYLERETTGNQDNAIVRYLELCLGDLSDKLMNSSTVIRKSDVSRLHMFWSEVSQFRAQIVSLPALTTLQQLLMQNDESAALRERMVQQSILGFSQRLESVYADYADISSPLQYALSHLRIGLHIVKQSTLQTDAAPASLISTALTLFPASASSEALAKYDEIAPLAIPPFQYVLLRASWMAWESSLGVEIGIEPLEITFDQALRLWLIDRAKEKDLDETAQSLYKHTRTDHEMITDVEREEQEFLALFPSFDDAFPSTSLHNSRSVPHLVPASDMSILLDLHHALFCTIPSDSSSSIFQTLRKSTLSTIIRSSFESLPDTLDAFGISIQLSTLRHRVSESRSPPSSNDREYNFYHDANIAQARRAAMVIGNLDDRLKMLLEEWPDQMVLHHLKSRCESALSLDLRSPVAKILSVLEQLLLQTDDWEIYANRHNSLRDLRDQFTTLIVDWRRLELSCWQGLLQFELKTFENGLAEWWFRLYDAIVRAPIDAMDCGKDTSLSAYLDTLIPLIDDFIRLSPLGQFQARLRLLQTFQSHCVFLAQKHVGARQLVAERVRNVLHATLSHYTLFLAEIVAFLSLQKSNLEKEVREFIKLASWKDVNVYALKQSAQKTHRQLYKVVHRFRDLLRQPVTDRLSASSTDSSDRELVIPSLPPASPEVAPDTWLDGGGNQRGQSTLPRRTSNTTTTYNKYQELVNSRIRPAITSRPIHLSDGLTVDIISSVKRLSAISIPNSLPAEKRDTQVKSLVTRKRKAWSDLLKELKRVGFAPNVTADVLQRQQDVRWIREQPIMPVSPAFFHSSVVSKGENYFTRLCNSLEELRRILPTHHPDLTSRELQRSVMFIESGFSMALDSRARLSEAYQAHFALQNLLRRFEMITPTAKIVASGPNAFQNLVQTKDILCRLASSLEEILDEMNTFNELEPRPPLADSVVESTQSMLALTVQPRDSLVAAVANIRLSTHAVILKHEFTLLCDAHDHISKAISFLHQTAESCPRLRYLFYPTYVWLNAQTLESPRLTPLAPNGDDTDPVIDACLINIQHLLARCPETISDLEVEEDGDNCIRDTTRAVRTMTAHLNVDKIVQRLEADLQDPRQDHHITIRRFMPFLQHYAQLVHDQLVMHSHWNTSLLKLIFVVCSVVRTLTKDGFCKPPDVGDSEDDGESTETGQGTGLGEGTGTENVSKEIEDESQVEGLQGDDAEGQEGSREQEDKNDTIEMSEDFTGELEDVPDKGSQEGDEDEDGTEMDPDERMGDLDGSDPDVVDEKLWGDEKGDDSKNTDQKTGQDRSEEKSGDSDVMAKESQEQESKKDSSEKPEGDAPADTTEDAPEQSVGEQEDADSRDVNGAPMDDHIPDADTLDLPDNLDMGAGEEKKDEMDVDDGTDEVDDAPDVEQSQLDDGFPQDADHEDPGPPDDPQEVGDEPLDQLPVQSEDAREDAEMPEDNAESAVAKPDLSGGDNAVEAGQGEDPATGENAQSGKTQGSAGVSSNEIVDERQGEDSADPSNNQTSLEVPQAGEPQGSGAAQVGMQPGARQPSQLDKPLSNNPLRSLGDTLKEVMQRFDQILESESSQEQPGGEMESSQVEYLRPDDADHEMQALGPAGEEQVAKLDKLHIVDEDVKNDAAMDIDDDPQVDSAPPEQATEKLPTQKFDATAAEHHEVAEGAIAAGTSHPQSTAVCSSHEEDDLKADVDMDDDGAIEAELRTWQSTGLPDAGAEHLWHRYASLTHDVAYALCEQLRLILEPTLATRLKGDYRTGKRLNMKKIIPYIASDYTKDKIWLRRTKPSQREYQVLIALDDSRSMAESHSVHLAYQTLALVSKALSRLEAGDIGIARFGETVDVLHGFEGAPFTDQAGVQVMEAFKFDQKATDVLSLLNTSLEVLERAREKRAMSSASAADLWQLEIIISDGMCQDHEKMRSVLRKAEEQRVMIVFIIIDSLHSAADSSAKNSILSMERAEFKNVDGRMELQLQRYLDSFPFEYYVVLRNVEALPEVLSGTLKQFFERISGE